MTGRAPKTCTEEIIKAHGWDLCGSPTIDGKPRCEEHTKPLTSYQRNAIARGRRTKKLTEAEKNYIRERDFHVCRECGAPAKDVDHVVEIADGGDNNPENLQLLCGPHHRAKTGQATRDRRDAMYEANGVPPWKRPKRRR